MMPIVIPVRGSHQRLQNGIEGQFFGDGVGNCVIESISIPTANFTSHPLRRTPHGIVQSFNHYISPWKLSTKVPKVVVNAATPCHSRQVIAVARKRELDRRPAHLV